MLQSLKIQRPLLGAVVLLWAGFCAAVSPASPELALGYNGLTYPAPVPGSYALPPIRPAPDGLLLDEESNQVSLHDVLRGKKSLLAFVYSNCSDVNGCPLAAHVFYQLKVAMQDDPVLADGLQLLSLSFDPQRDTPEVMKLYGRNFQYAGERGDWRFLTTESETTLAPILKDYGQELQRQLSVEGDENIEYGHILRVFLIDANLQIRNIYGVSFLHPELLVADVRTLLLEHPLEPSNNAAHELIEGRPVQRLRRIRQSPLGLPALEASLATAHSVEEISLGRRLFFDRRLSHNGTFSCAMCHVPSQGFSNNELATSVGLEGRSVRRNAPSLYNVGFAERLFHDGRDSQLEEQIWSPLLARNEMANPSVGFVMHTLRSLPVYQREFQAVYAESPNVANLGRALAAYQRSLNSGDSNFDRWHFGGDSNAVDKSVQRGFELFRGKARCSACHTLGEHSALFSDWKLHNTGTGYLNSMGGRAKKQRVQVAPGVFVEVDMDIIDRVSEVPAADLGRYEITQDPADRWKYRTPSLRNVALTAPYMHDGSLRSLAEVLTFYNNGGEPNINLSPLVKPLQLSDQELLDIEAFLLSLTGNDVDDIVQDALAAPVGDPGGDGVEGSTLDELNSEYRS